MKLNKWDVLLLVAILGIDGPVTWRAYKEHRCLAKTAKDLQTAVDQMHPGVLRVLECVEGPRGATVLCSLEGRDANGEVETVVLQGPSRCD